MLEVVEKVVESVEKAAEKIEKAVNDAIHGAPPAEPGAECQASVSLPVHDGLRWKVGCQFDVHFGLRKPEAIGWDWSTD